MSMTTTPLSITWPEPRFVPTPSGAQLNPERVDQLYTAIKHELTYVEMLMLIEQLTIDPGDLQVLLRSAQGRDEHDDNS